MLAGRLLAMSTIGIEKQTPSYTMADRFESKINEVMAFCPACKAFETVYLNNGKLNQNHKFTQFGNHIYHDCGSNTPCRLYMTT
jgi:hypothetical protein